jgi:hypothetical protein
MDAALPCKIVRIFPIAAVGATFPVFAFGIVSGGSDVSAIADPADIGIVLLMFALDNADALLLFQKIVLSAACSGSFEGNASVIYFGEVKPAAFERAVRAVEFGKITLHNETPFILKLKDSV